MPTIPCLDSSRCFPCPDDLATLNLSAEFPDDYLWFGENTKPIPVNLDDADGDDGFSKKGCKYWCYSSVSQVEANACAALQASLCNVPGGGFDLPADNHIHGGGDGGGGTVYVNTLQVLNCPGGVSLTDLGASPPPGITLTAIGMQAEAGLWEGTTQAAADAAALDDLIAYWNIAEGLGQIECITEVWSYSLLAPGTNGQVQRSTAAIVPEGIDAVFRFPTELQFPGDYEIVSGGWVGCRFGPYSIATRIYVDVSYEIPYVIAPGNSSESPNEFSVGALVNSFVLNYGFVSAIDGSLPLGDFPPTQYQSIAWNAKMKFLSGNSAALAATWVGSPLIGKKWEATIMKELAPGEIYDFMVDLFYQMWSYSSFTWYPMTVSCTHSKIFQNLDLSWPVYAGTVHAPLQEGIDDGVNTIQLNDGDSTVLTGTVGNGAATAYVFHGDSDVEYKSYCNIGGTLTAPVTGTGFTNYHYVVIPADEVTVFP